jgi:hypothetical protein
MKVALFKFLFIVYYNSVVWELIWFAKLGFTLYGLLIL